MYLWPSKKVIVPNKLLKALKIVSFGLMVFLIGSLLALGSVAYAYKGKYYPGVTVGGLKLGGLTKAEGEAAVNALTTTYTDHKVVVTVPNVVEGLRADTGRYDEVEIATTTEELGLAFNPTEPLSTAWKLGHVRQPLAWAVAAIPAFFHPTAISLP